MTDAQLIQELSDLQVVGLTLWAEGRSEPVEGRIAIGAVIRNRTMRPALYGKGYRGVCLKRWQFSCWIPEGGTANYDALMRMSRSLLAGMSKPVLDECLFIADGIQRLALLDNSGGSTHYLTRSLYATKPPKWTAGLKPSRVIGEHIFFSGVDR